MSRLAGWDVRLVLAGAVVAVVFLVLLFGGEQISTGGGGICQGTELPSFCRPGVTVRP